MEHVSWSLGLFSKNHLLEVGLTQNWRPWHSNISHYYVLIMFEDPAWIEIPWNMIEDLVTYDFTLHLRACDHTPWFWKCLETTFGHFFWALIVSWSRVLTRVWSGPKPRYPMPISKLDDFSHLRQFLSNPKTFIELQIKFLHPSNIKFPTLLVKSNTTYVFSTTLL